MRRTLSAGVAAGALAALLVGVPWFLLQFTSVAHLLSANWVTALTVGADSRLILALLSAVAWAAWAVVAITVIFELVAVLSRQRIQLHLPGTGWLRPAIGALVISAIAAPGAAMADSGQGSSNLGVHLPQVASLAAPQEPAAIAVTTEAGRSYAVQPGDELWSIAEQELGSGERWRDIVALNDGLSETSRLVAGSVLMLPEEPAPTASVVVEEGDTLWHIAESELGDPTRWPELHAANAEQIPDPDQIEVGWELQLPAGVSQASTPVADPAAAASAVEETDSPSPSAAPAPAPATEEFTTVQEAAPSTPEQAAEEAFGPGMPEPTQAEDVSPTTPAPLASENSGHADESTEISATSDADPDASTAEDYSEMLTPVGAALAGSVLLGVATRRRTQLLARAVGRRLIPVPVQVARFWTALAQHADDAAPTPQSDSPTTVVLGWDGEDPVELDIEAERAALFTGDASGAALGAVITSLSCDPSSSPVQLMVVGGPDWVHALDDPRIEGEDTTQAGLDHLTRLCSERRLAMRGRTLTSMRADADLTEAFAPTVVVFLSPLSPTALDAVGDALALGEVGVSVVAACTSPAHLPYAHVEVQSETASFRGQQFTPQLVTAPARRALISLFSSTGRIDTKPAPWWKVDDDLPPNVHPLPRQDSPEERPMTMLLAPPSSPLLSLLGTVELHGATGTLPSRALGQCMEYCAWLLQNPGATPTRMLRDLQVADTTRRSNMSRLRSWLGLDPDGSPYLPDAYSGRIALDERVTSDWEQFNALMAGGVNTASNEALRTALSLVSGEPLGTFAFQWHWAQELRADMTAMIVDAACVLADRALAHNNLTEASWAINQGLLGAPSDDALAVRKIECSALSGNQAETEHAVVRLNRSLRVEGRDLEPALALRIQAALRPRAQRAVSAAE